MYEKDEEQRNDDLILGSGIVTGQVLEGEIRDVAMRYRAFAAAGGGSRLYCLVRVSIRNERFNGPEAEFNTISAQVPNTKSTSVETASNTFFLHYFTKEFMHNYTHGVHLMEDLCFRANLFFVFRNI